MIRLDEYLDVKKLDNYYIDETYLFNHQLKNYQINEGLFSLLALIWAWFWNTDEDYYDRMDSRPCWGDSPWMYSPLREDPHKPRKEKKNKPKKETQKKSKKQSSLQDVIPSSNTNKTKTDEEEVVQNVVQNNPDVAKKLKQTKKTKPIVTPKVEPKVEPRPADEPTKPEDTPHQEAPENVEQEVETTKQETENTNEQKPFIGVVPPENTVSHINKSDVSLHNITDDTEYIPEKPLDILFGILLQNKTNDKKKEGFWHTASIVNLNRNSSEKIGKRPWYIQYYAISQKIDGVPCAVIGMFVYSERPADYLNSQFNEDDKHANYLHIFAFDIIENYKKSNVFEDVVMCEAEKIVKDNKLSGITIEYYNNDEKTYYEKYGFVADENDKTSQHGSHLAIYTIK